MREILFRGKRIDNGEWVVGGYRHEKVGEYLTAVFVIEPLTDGVWEHHRVDPATVGQYTGLTDKNGKRIFEGDIVILPALYGRGKAVIAYCGAAFKACGEVFAYQVSESMEVIGNIHDNPELMKEG